MIQFIAKGCALRESRAPGQGEHPSPGWPYRTVGWDKNGEWMGGGGVSKSLAFTGDKIGCRTLSAQAPDTRPG